MHNTTQNESNGQSGKKNWPLLVIDYQIKCKNQVLYRDIHLNVIHQFIWYKLRDSDEARNVHHKMYPAESVRSLSLVWYCVCVDMKHEQSAQCIQCTAFESMTEKEIKQERFAFVKPLIREWVEMIVVNFLVSINITENMNKFERLRCVCVVFFYLVFIYWTEPRVVYIECCWVIYRWCAVVVVVVVFILTSLILVPLCPLHSHQYQHR